jgi:hypothetical protein
MFLAVVVSSKFQNKVSVRQSLIPLPHMALSFLLLYFVVLLCNIPEAKYHHSLSGRGFPLKQPLLPYHSISISPGKLSHCRYAANARALVHLPSTVNFTSRLDTTLNHFPGPDFSRQPTDISCEMLPKVQPQIIYYYTLQ